MESPNLLLGQGSERASADDPIGPGRGLRGEADRQRPDASPLESLNDLEIEETVREEEERGREDEWLDWIPEIQEALKDKALSILGDRFKIEYIAETLSRNGMTDAKDVIKFIIDSYGTAQQIHPKYMPMDALYKAMRDGQLTATGALR